MPTPSSDRRPSTRRLTADFWGDLRYTIRAFSRQPGFAVAAVLTLALGIGANSAIFSVVHGVLLESLPFAEADRLYRLRMVHPDRRATTTLSAPDFMSVRERTRVFERVEAYTSGAVTMLGAGEPRDVRVASVSDGLFELLGLRVVIGRAFVRDENLPGRNHVAILDHGFWQRAFGADESAVGRRVTVGGISYEIVGVLAAGARLPADVSGARVPSDADLYLPIEFDGTFNAATATRRRSNYLGVLGRAQPGMSSAAVDEDLNRIGTELQALFPETNARLTMNAVSARELIVGDVRRPLLMLLGAVGFVLLVACANVASLVLARASAREDELAVRAALGAGRGRLLRQLLTEALVLGLIGGAIGLTLAYAGTRALVAAQPTDIPRLDEVGLDLTIVFFTCGIALFASLAFGAFPALQATGHLARGLRAGGRTGGVDRRSRRMRAGLVIAEVALAVVLLTGAGLLFRSLVALARVAPGFDAGQAISFRFALYGRGYDPALVRTRLGEIEAALRAIPGVSGVAATTVLPLSGPGQRMAFSVVGVPPPAADVNSEIGVASVTPEYVRTIGAVLVRGRDLTDRDRGGAAPVAVVNDAAVRRWFAGADPIGARVRASGACEPTGACEIVGVIRDVLQGDPRQQAAPQLFVPHAQRAARSIWIVLRSQGDPLALAPSIRATIHGLDQDLALSDFTPLDRLHAGAIARPRFYTALLALFAGLALVLAVTGIFGVMSYTVAERTREIGIRMALGAQRHDILRLIVGGTLALAAAGIVLGLAATLAVGRVIRSQLFGVEVLDLPTLAFVGVMLLTSAAVAACLPARRAARLDPASTLRLGKR